MRVYGLDKNDVFTGESKELSPREPITRDFTHIAPPDTQDYAVFDGAKWFTRTEYPQSRQASLKPDRRITRGEFFDRFGDQKYAVLSSTDPMVRALIEDVKVREFIDLDDPQLPEGLQMVVDAGFSIDPDVILGSGPEVFDA